MRFLIKWIYLSKPKNRRAGAKHSSFSYLNVENNEGDNNENINNRERI